MVWKCTPKPQLVRLHPTKSKKQPHLNTQSILVIADAVTETIVVSEFVGPGEGLNPLSRHSVPRILKVERAAPGLRVFQYRCCYPK